MLTQEAHSERPPGRTAKHPGTTKTLDGGKTLTNARQSGDLPCGAHKMKAAPAMNANEFKRVFGWANIEQSWDGTALVATWPYYQVGADRLRRLAKKYHLAVTWRRSYPEDLLMVCQTIDLKPVEVDKRVPYTAIVLGDSDGRVLHVRTYRCLAGDREAASGLGKALFRKECRCNFPITVVEAGLVEGPNRDLIGRVTVYRNPDYNGGYYHTVVPADFYEESGLPDFTYEEWSGPVCCLTGKVFTDHVEPFHGEPRDINVSGYKLLLDYLKK